MFGIFRRKTVSTTKQGQTVKAEEIHPPISIEQQFLDELNDHGQALAQSKVYEAFNPSKPISSLGALSGRQSETRMCLQKLMSPGGNVLLFGDRGVGKSSIGYVICDTYSKLNGFQDYKIHVYRCDSADTLQSIFSAPLRDLGHNIDIQAIQTSFNNAEAGNVGGEVDIFGAKIGSSLSKEQHTGLVEDHKSTYEQASSPQWIANELAQHKTLLFIDELDKVTDETVKHGLATIVKHISDSPQANMKFLLAGIAQNAAELTAGHPSVQRCLAEIEIGRLEDKYLINILEKGEGIVLVPSNTGERALSFTAEIKKEIAKKSFGYPYFTHLIAQAATIRAVQEKDPEVDEDFELEYAIDEAVKNAEGSLIKSLDHAISNDTSGHFRRLLISAAEYHNIVLSAADWKTAFQERWDEELSTGKLTPYLKRLVAGKDELEEWKVKNNRQDPIFIRESSGLYRFQDPRMPSFIRLALSGAANDLAKVKT